jgi:hypothetical protein
MNIFFFYTGSPTPILETDFELIRKHDKAGHNIKILQCTGNLPNCHWNLKHDDSTCSICTSKFKNGWDVLKPSKNVELIKFNVSDGVVVNLPSAFKSIDEVKAYKFDNENIGYGVASTLVSIFRDHRFNTNRYYPEIIRTLTSAIELYKTLKIQFKQFKPDRVYVFNGRTATQLPAILLCKKLGVEYLTYEVASKENSYRLVKNSTTHEAIAIEEVNLLRFNWNADSAKLADLFYRKKRDGANFENLIKFTNSQEKGTLPKAFDFNKKNIAIFNSTIDEYAAIEGWNCMYSPDETAGIGKILESFISDDYIFYLRVHPHMKEVASSTSQLLDIRELTYKFKNLHVIWPDSIVDTYALIDACEKVITFGSTVGAEATYWGKPSICAGHAPYKNFNCVYEPHSHEELIQLLRSDLKPIKVEGALQYAFWEINNGIKFQYFKQKGFRNGLAYGTFDGVEIKPNLSALLRYKLTNFPRRFKKAVMNPSLIILKLRNIFR